jgi:plasmid maintenance system antidote protein VapI
MRRELTGLLALSVMLSACQATVKGVTPRQPSRVASAAPATLPSAGAKLPNTVAGSPAPVLPGESVVAVNGLLNMDPSAVIAAGGGNVIAAGGGNVIAAGGGNLIKVGGDVIAAGGGNVIAPGSGNYRTLAIEVPLGDLLPAQGMVVVPVSLRTGEALGPAVLTDAEGRYTLQIPVTEKGNVRVIAAVPGKTADDPLLDDPKLQSESLVSGTPAASGAQVVMDDDHALVSRFFRRAFLGRLDELLTVSVKDPQGSGNPLFDEVWNGLIDAAIAAKTAEMPRKARRELAERLANNLIYHVDLRAIMVDRSGPDWPGETDETVFAAYREILRSARLAAAAKLRANRKFFDDQPYVREANARLAAEPGAEAWVIRRPKELGHFVTAEYMEHSGRLGELKDVFASIGVKPKMVHRLRAAETGLTNALALTLVLNKEARADMLKQMGAAGKR